MLQHCEITNAPGEGYTFWCLTHKAPAIHVLRGESDYPVCFKYAQVKGCLCCPGSGEPLEELSADDLFEKASGLFAELSEVFAALGKMLEDER